MKYEATKSLPGLDVPTFNEVVGCLADGATAGVKWIWGKTKPRRSGINEIIEDASIDKKGHSEKCALLLNYAKDNDIPFSDLIHDVPNGENALGAFLYNATLNPFCKKQNGSRCDKQAFSTQAIARLLTDSIYEVYRFQLAEWHDNRLCQELEEEGYSHEE